MPSLFRRRSAAELVDDAAPEPDPTAAASGRSASGARGQAAGPSSTAGPAEEESAEPEPRRPRGYTPSKQELGKVTPKRPTAHVRRPGLPSPASARKDLTKEERRQLREERRQRRREVSEGMRRGDERYLSGRDRGPERALARDVVDSRRTVGTFFFAGALIVLLGSSATMPPQVRLVANLFWAVLAVGVVLDVWLLCRKVKRLLRKRYPDSTQKLGGLYLYVAMRSITFRKLRVPLPRVKFGDRI